MLLFSLVLLNLNSTVILTLCLNLLHLSLLVSLCPLGNPFTLLFLKFLQVLLIVYHDVLTLVWLLLLLKGQSLSILLLFVCIVIIGICVHLILQFTLLFLFHFILLLLLHLQLELVLVLLISLVSRYHWLSFLLNTTTVRIISLLVLVLLLMWLVRLPHASCHMLVLALCILGCVISSLFFLISILVFFVLLAILLFIVFLFMNFRFSHHIFFKILIQSIIFSNYLI